jgi:N-dimethylarginine dimethylaminohydrolase
MEVTAEVPKAYGGQSMTGTLRRVLVRTPRAEDRVAWRAYGWHAEPDPVKASDEHEAFCALLEDAGAEVVLGQTPIGLCPDQIYVHDPALVSDRGAILLRPGKEGRRIEVDAMGADLVEAGLPIAATLQPPALAEGGDLIWLDERTLLVGRGYRTNDDGVLALAEALPDVEMVVFDLPHLRGRGEVLHLMSLLSLLDADLAVAYPSLMPVRLVELLKRRGVELVEVPDEEFESMGPNVLALAPRVALALDGNAETRRRLERAGVDVAVYSGEEISRKGDGGPTCLTRPLLRA